MTFKEIKNHIFDISTGEHLPQCIARDILINQMEENRRRMAFPFFDRKKLGKIKNKELKNKNLN